MSRAFGPLVLCYHAVSASWDHLLSVAPDRLEAQLERLLARGYRPVAASEAIGGRGRLLHVTFDDAFRSVQHALPILERLGAPATVFACSEHAEDGRPLAVPELALEAAEHPEELATMSWDTLRGLAERGIEIGSHTVSHPHLTSLSDVELARELRESRERVEDELGARCRYIAYPYGDEDARIQAAARRAGYEAGFALPGAESRWRTHAIPRVGVYRGDSRVKLALKTFAPARRAAALVSRTSGRRR